MAKLDFDDVKKGFKRASTLNECRAYYKYLTSNFYLSEKQEDAVFGFFRDRRTTIYSKLRAKGCEGVLDKDFMEAWGDLEV